MPPNARIMTGMAGQQKGWGSHTKTGHTETVDVVGGMLLVPLAGMTQKL